MLKVCPYNQNGCAIKNWKCLHHRFVHLQSQVRDAGAPGWNIPHTSASYGCSDCFSYSVEDLCSHETSDHNYFGVCQVTISATFFKQLFLHEVFCSFSLLADWLFFVSNELRVKRWWNWLKTSNLNFELNVMLYHFLKFFLQYSFFFWNSRNKNFNLFQGILAPNAFSLDIPQGLLHTIPEDVRVKNPLLPRLLAECGTPSSPGGRFEAAVQLLEILKQI